MSDLTILLPAAGASARMQGRDKLLEEIDGIPLLRRTTQIALQAAPHVVVTLRNDDRSRRLALQGLPAFVLTIPDAAEGLSASLRAGARTATGPLMILPADMPDITADDLRTLIAAAAEAPHAILRGADGNGTPGHPVLFPPDVLPAFARLGGDEGARSILQANRDRVRLIPLPDSHALTDLDTPEAWAEWRLRRS